MDLNNKELLKQQLKNLNYDQLEKLLIRLTKYNLLLSPSYCFLTNNDIIKNVNITKEAISK